MKILMIIQYWYPYEGALQPIYGSILKNLIKQGDEVTIITSFPHFRKGRSEEWKEFRGKFSQSGDWEGAHLIRSWVFAPVYRSDRLKIIFRGLTFLSFFFSSLLVALRLKRHDLVFVPSTPPLLGSLTARLLRLFKGTPFIVNLQDIFPDIAIDSGLLKNSLLNRFLHFVSRYTYRAADKILVISDEMRNTIVNKGISAQKIEVIPNFCDIDFIRPLPKDNSFARKHGVADKFVVMFAGNIGLVQGIDKIIGAAEILKAERQIVFLFIGRGENRYRMEQLAEKKGLSQVRFLPLHPESEMPEIWASADCGIISLKPGITAYAFPSKTYGIMAAARAVVAITEPESAPARMISASESGFVVRPGDVEGLASAILELKNSGKRCRKMGLNGRSYVERFNHPERISEQYGELFRAVVNSHLANRT